MLREERGPRVFENRPLKRIFGPNRDEVKWNWRRLSKEKLNDLYSDNQIKDMIRACSTYGGKVRSIKKAGGET
jgi:hypothetical protein